MVMRRVLCVGLVALLGASSAITPAHARRGRVLGGLLGGLVSGLIVRGEMRRQARDEARQVDLEAARLRLEAERQALYGAPEEAVYGYRPRVVYPVAEEVVVEDYPRPTYWRRHRWRPSIPPPECVRVDYRYEGYDGYRSTVYRPPRYHRYYR